MECGRVFSLHDHQVSCRRKLDQRLRGQPVHASLAAVQIQVHRCVWHPGRWVRTIHAHHIGTGGYEKPTGVTRRIPPQLEYSKALIVHTASLAEICVPRDAVT